MKFIRKVFFTYFFAADTLLLKNMYKKAVMAFIYIVLITACTRTTVNEKLGLKSVSDKTKTKEN